MLDPLYKSTDHLVELFARIVGRKEELFRTFAFQSDFAQKPLNGADANLRPIIALAQAAFSLGAGYDAHPACAAFQGVHKILPIHFAAARHFMDHDPHAVLLPLARQRCAPLGMLRWQTYTITSGDTVAVMTTPLLSQGSTTRTANPISKPHAHSNLHGFFA